MSKIFLGVVFSLTILAITGLSSEAEATSYVLSDQASCLALPATTTWIASTNTCELSDTLTIGSGDTLQIQSTAELVIKKVGVSQGTLDIDGGSLTNDAGTITVDLGGRWLVDNGATISNINGATITNNGLLDIRGGSSLTNDATSTITTNNQFTISEASTTVTNNGAFTNSNSLKINVGSTFSNVGTLTNSGTITISSLFLNSGTLTNNNSINMNCNGTFTDTGTFIGNPPDLPFCFIGSVSNKWSNPANWNLNALPLSDSRIFPSGAHLDIPFTFNGAIMDPRGMVIDPSGTFTNDGFLFSPSNQLGILFTNNGVFINNGEISTILSISNTGTFTNNGKLTGNIIMENSGTFTNSATGQMTAGMENLSSGVFNNFGAFDMNRSTNNNHGTFNNNAGTLNINNDLFNKNGGNIVNSAIININHALNFPGDLFNEAGAVVTNNAAGTIAVTASTSSVTNDGFILTFGIFTNGGTVTNNNFICGTITGNPVVGNAPLASCDSDNDGVLDPFDLCPLDPLNDADGDGVCGDVDNCPDDVNADQADNDGDGIGTVCEPDSDSDGIPDNAYGEVCTDGNNLDCDDNCPIDANSDQADSDGDGIGETCDVDRFVPESQTFEVLNCFSKGVMPLLVYSLVDFDSTTIDLYGLTLNGVPITEKHNKHHSDDKDGDGNEDLTLHFKTQDVCEIASSNGVFIITLEGTASEGTVEFSTSTSVTIRGFR